LRKNPAFSARHCWNLSCSGLGCGIRLKSSEILQKSSEILPKSRFAWVPRAALLPCFCLAFALRLPCFCLAFALLLRGAASQKGRKRWPLKGGPSVGLSKGGASVGSRAANVGHRTPYRKRWPPTAVFSNAKHWISQGARTARTSPHGALFPGFLPLFPGFVPFSPGFNALKGGHEGFQQWCTVLAQELFRRRAGLAGGIAANGGILAFLRRD